MGSIENLIPIWFLVTKGTPPMDIAGPLDAFRHASRQSKSTRYELNVVSVGERVVESDCHMKYVADFTLDEIGNRSLPHTLIICGGNENIPDGSEEAELVRWLTDNLLEPVSAPKRIASICSGAMLLAQTGLLAGRRATTHWQLVPEFKSRHPEVEVLTDTLFVQDDRFWTSAGVLSGIDMALAMIEQDLSTNASMEVAKFLVMYIRRGGNQHQLSHALVSQVSDRPTLRDLLVYIRENLDADLSVDRLADMSCMSARNLARVFQSETGTSLGKFVRETRLEAACQLLERLDDPLSVVAKRVGIESESTLRRWFTDHFGLSPGQYREKHRAAKQ